MSDNTQLTITGEEASTNNAVEIVTEGRVIRPFKRILSRFVDEYRIRFDESGIRVCMCDPANVAMYDVTLHSDAFERYEIDGDVTIGMDSGPFGSLLRHARYGEDTSDEIHLTIEEANGRFNYANSWVEREYGNNRVEFNERVALIDPDSIRQKPDIPELNLTGEVDVDPDAFCNVISSLSDYQHAHFSVVEDGLLLNAEGEVDETDVFIDADAEGSGSSVYSLDYIDDVRYMMENGLVDDMTIRVGDEFPIMVEFEREGVYSGRAMVAPRVESE